MVIHVSHVSWVTHTHTRTHTTHTHTHTHTYAHIRTHAYKVHNVSDATNMNDSRVTHTPTHTHNTHTHTHTHTRTYAHTHTECETRVMLHTWMIHYKRCYTYEWFVSDVTHMNNSWVMSHIWIIHASITCAVTRMHDSCTTNECAKIGRHSYFRTNVVHTELLRVCIHAHVKGVYICILRECIHIWYSM